MRCLDSMKITEILRLYELGFNYRDIASSVGCSKTTVGEIITNCKKLSIDYVKAFQMSSEELNLMLHPQSFGRKATKKEPDWQKIHERLKSSRRINIQYIWEEEYRPYNPDGYSYSHFCNKYRAWLKNSGNELILPTENEPGKELFIDWVGDTLDCVVDIDTGEVLTAHFFVTTYYDHIHTLFSLYQLSEAETDIMRNLALAPLSGVQNRLFANWLKLRDMNTVNNLIEKGFIKAMEETRPSVQTCHALLDSLQKICLRHREEVTYYKQLFQTIESFELDMLEAKKQELLGSYAQAGWCQGKINMDNNRL